jgi:hypothetical protein
MKYSKKAAFAALLIALIAAVLAESPTRRQASAMLPRKRQSWDWLAGLK